MEVAPDDKHGTKPEHQPYSFYQSLNTQYGQNWMSEEGKNLKEALKNPMQGSQELHNDKDLELKNTLRTFKHGALHQMREQGQLDTQVYS